MGQTKAENKLNLKLLDGIRCLCCIWIICLHCNAFSGMGAFPQESPCLQYLRSIPTKKTLIQKNRV